MSETYPNKRENARVKVKLSCTFGPTEDTPRSGTVTSISSRGCFVQTRAWAEKGARMFLRIWLPQRSWLLIPSSVLYHMDKIGIGLRFDELSAEDVEALRDLVEEKASEETSASDDAGDGSES